MKWKQRVHWTGTGSLLQHGSADAVHAASRAWRRSQPSPQLSSSSSSACAWPQAMVPSPASTAPPTPDQTGHCCGLHPHSHHMIINAHPSGLSSVALKSVRELLGAAWLAWPLPCTHLLASISSSNNPTLHATRVPSSVRWQPIHG